MRVSLTFTDQAELAIYDWCKEHTNNSPFFLCDSNTYNYCYPKLKSISDKCIVIPAGEQSKQMQTLDFILSELVRFGVKNSDVLINLGGGVVTDIGGFAASIYRRGIKFIHIPTSLMGMADAAIGGKTGIDYKHLKNYIGTFAQPEMVVISTEFLDTLPKNEVQSAWAEIIKTGSILDAELFEMICSDTPIKQVIKRCAEAKKTVVVQDVYDKAQRQLLNFGHTIGHAYETYNLSISSPVMHGIAVAKGMLFELEIAKEIKLLNEEDFQKICALIEQKIGVEKITENEWYNIKQYLISDKKNTDSKITFSLPIGIGSGRFGIKLNLGEIKWKG